MPNFIHKSIISYCFDLSIYVSKGNRRINSKTRKHIGTKTSEYRFVLYSETKP